MLGAYAPPGSAPFDLVMEFLVPVRAGMASKKARCVGGR